MAAAFLTAVMPVGVALSARRLLDGKPQGRDGDGSGQGGGGEPDEKDIAPGGGRASLVYGGQLAAHDRCGPQYAEQRQSGF